MRQTPAMRVHRYHRGGFGLVEALMAMCILGGLSVAIAIAIVACTKTAESTREFQTADAALAGACERLKTTPFASVWSQYRDGGSPGPEFDVPGLDPAPGDADGRPGRIRLYIDERVVDPALGLPRDLNGDGDAIDPDVSGSYLLLPARVAVEYRSRTGPARKVEALLLLGRR